MLLTHINQYVNLTEQEVNEITSVLTHKAYSRNTSILNEGEQCRYFYFITSGSLRCYYTTERQKELTVMFAFPGWWITDMDCYINRSPSQATIVALEETKCLRLGRGDYDQLLISIPKLERYFRILLQNAYIREQQRAREAISLSSTERYLNLIARYAQIEQRVSQKHLASYLGITPQFLSVLKGDLKIQQFSV